MAARIDQEQIVKYADKVFLLLALAFLAYAAVMLVMGPGEPQVTYGRVVSAYRAAESNMEQVDDQYINEELLADDPVARQLYGQRPGYDEQFAAAQAEQAPAWLQPGLSRPPVYKPLLPPTVEDVPLLKVPPMDRRIAPEGLLLLQFKGYIPSGNEQEGRLGRDVFGITGQVAVDLAQQTLWSQEVNGVDENPDWKARIKSTLVTGIDVQRSERRTDGQWGPWQDIQTVAQKVADIPPDGDPEVLNTNERAREDFMKVITKLRERLSQNQDVLLHPPFYNLAGLDELPMPFDVLPSETEGPAGGAAPMTEPGGLPPLEGPDGLPPLGGNPAAMDEPMPGEGPAAMPSSRRAEMTAHFNDLIDQALLGKTFRYRCRVRFLNPILGADRTEVEKARDAWIVQVPGRWSDPSPAITLDRIDRFFFIGSFGEKANFRLYHWQWGQWREIRSATVALGDPIRVVRPMTLEVPTDRGGTVKLPRPREVTFDPGATVVNITETTTNYQGVMRPTNRLVYYDAMTNSLMLRMSVADRDEAARFLDQQGQQEEARRRAPTRTRRPRPTTGRPRRGPTGVEPPIPPQEDEGITPGFFDVE